MSGRGDRRVLCAALGAVAGISAILLSPLRGELIASKRQSATHSAQPQAVLHVLSPRAPAPNAIRLDSPRPDANAREDVRPARLHATQTSALEITEDEADQTLEADGPAIIRTRDSPDVAPGDPHKVVPHPIDEPRRRMTAQRQLFSEVKSALHDANFAHARALLKQHDEDFTAAESWTDQREGYQLMLDCQQHPSDETRARGQRFVDEQRGSTLRRSVRRACLR